MYERQKALEVQLEIEHAAAREASVPSSGSAPTQPGLRPRAKAGETPESEGLPAAKKAKKDRRERKQHLHHVPPGPNCQPEAHFLFEPGPHADFLPDLRNLFLKLA